MANFGMFVLAGAVAGLHSACWGAYRDPPYEKFSGLKFVRSVVLGAALGAMAFYLLRFYAVAGVNIGVVLVFVMGYERIFTEFFKIFVREEDERKYRIPMRFHYLGKIVGNRFKRFLIGICLVFVSFMAFHILASVKTGLPVLSSTVIGLFAGITVAVCGAYRASPFEGFRIKKFFKSPISGFVSGLILGNFSQNYPLIFFGAIGLLHMILQSVKIISLFLIGESAPSKFGDRPPAYIKYLKTRHVILLPYILTWACFIFFLLSVT